MRSDESQKIFTHTHGGAVESLLLINLSWYIVVIFLLWGLLEIFVIASLIIQKTGVNEIWCVPVSLSVNCSLVKLTFFCTKQSWILRTFSFLPEPRDRDRSETARTLLWFFFFIILFWVFLFVQPETRKEKRSDISSGRDGFHPLCEDVQMSSIVVNLVGGIPSMHLGQDWEFNLSILLTSKRISDKASSSVLRLEQVLDEWDSFYDIKFECELSFRDSFWCISTWEHSFNLGVFVLVEK